jgi:hypothetical protein
LGGARGGGAHNFGAAPRRRLLPPWGSAPGVRAARHATTHTPKASSAARSTASVASSRAEGIVRMRPGPGVEPGSSGVSPGVICSALYSAGRRMCPKSLIR